MALLNITNTFNVFDIVTINGGVATLIDITIQQTGIIGIVLTNEFIATDEEIQLDTRAYNEGDKLYAGLDGRLTTTQPINEQFYQVIGFVIKQSVLGRIFIYATNNQYLNEQTMATLDFKDPILEISRLGLYADKISKTFNVIGRRSGFTSTSIFNDVKEFGSGVDDIPVLSNSTLDIISSSASDTSAGTGVRTVVVTYINNSNNIVESAPITLNGTTLVTNVLTGVNAILFMETATAGSGGVAAGNIRLRINGGTVEVEQISAGGNKSMTAFFMIPLGYSGYIKSIQGTAVGTTQDIRLRATVNTIDRTLSTVYHYQDNLYLGDGQQGQNNIEFLKYPELSKIKMSTISGATPVANKADVSFQVILIEN